MEPYRPPFRLLIGDETVQLFSTRPIRFSGRTYDLYHRPGDHRRWIRDRETGDVMELLDFTGLYLPGEIMEAEDPRQGY